MYVLVTTGGRESLVPVSGLENENPAQLTPVGQFRKRLLPGLLFLAADALLFSGLPALAQSPIEERISRETLRSELVATDEFMEFLGVRPGMTILDVGTGTGQFAYRFAERLAGTGKVFATDIDERCVSFVKEEARRRGLGNLHPVLVERDGFDDFYSRQRYDLVIVFHVGMGMSDERAFLARMRDFMAEGGRVVRMHYKAAAPFSQKDLSGRFPELIRELTLEPAESPFSKGLRETTRQMILRSSEAEPDETLREAVVEDFNGMQRDVNFSRAFVVGSSLKEGLDFTRVERSFADDLLDLLAVEGVFDRNPGVPSAKAVRIFTRFNKLLFLQRFRKYLQADGLFVPGSSPRFWEQAGFRFLKEDHAIHPFEDISIFGVDQRTGSDGR